jgi:DNA-binding MarR family transcriptional regulator
VGAASTERYRFGDVLALARLSWVHQISDRLARRGFADYRRSDAAMVRILAGDGRSVGETGAALGVTRQAARKLIGGLEQRGYATTERDPRDTRVLRASLSGAGRRYARAIATVVDGLERDLERRVTPQQLAAADAVLRASVAGTPVARRVAAVAPPRAAPPAPSARPARPPGRVRGGRPPLT